jgi:hypothetical protein
MTHFDYKTVSLLAPRESVVVPAGAFMYYHRRKRLYLNLGNSEREALYRFPSADWFEQNLDFRIRDEGRFGFGRVSVVNCEFVLKTASSFIGNNTDVRYCAETGVVSLPDFTYELPKHYRRILVSTRNFLPPVRCTVSADELFALVPIRSVTVVMSDIATDHEKDVA